VAFPDDVLVPGERVAVHVHPHWKTLVGPVPALLVVGVVTIYLASAFSTGAWTFVLVLVALGAVGGLTVVPVLRWFTTHLVVTDRRVLVREGILTREGVDVPLSRITGVRSSRSAVESLLGCGTLVVDTAADEPLEIEDVPDVVRVQGLLSPAAGPGRRPADPDGE
jgi:uncharacterized membrane protein YdbT with pleckstrin-like domain